MLHCLIELTEYVRIKSVENIQSGLFSIQICFWDFFERKLPEYQKVFDWYLKNENFHRIKSASLLFSNGETESIYQPKFQKTINRYIKKEPEQEIGMTSVIINPSMNLAKFLELQNRREKLLLDRVEWEAEKFDWHQNFWFKLNIYNTGQSVIEDFKLELDFEGEFLKVGNESPKLFFEKYFKTDVYEYSNTVKSLYIKPVEKTLVQGDKYTTSSIYLKPALGVETEVAVYWKLLARDFEDQGKLSINIQPLYHTITHINYVSEEERPQETSISLIKRKGSREILGRGIYFTDKETDYEFKR